MAGERTEQATPHRRQQARKEGDILHSRELSAAAGTLLGVVLLGRMGAQMLEAWRGALVGFLALGPAEHWEGSEILLTLSRMRSLALVFLAPAGFVVGSVALAVLGIGILQTGGISASLSHVGIRFDRINPWTNLTALFSLRAAARLGKSLVPAAVLAVFASRQVARQWSTPPFSIVRLAQLGPDVYSLLITAAFLLFAWAAVDYAVEWRAREGRLRMSREDLRQEFKETEGNPQIRSRLRGLQRQMRRRKARADVARAAVVLTNPTHYAVALGFDFVAMDTPRVLAKGRNLFAEEIKAEARWSGVPVIENPPLARSLYRSVEVGQSIPADLYAAIAAILAYLYRQRAEQEMRERRTREQAKPPAAPDGGDERAAHQNGLGGQL